MMIASRTQFHIERPWGQRPFSIVSSRSLLRNYKPSDGIFEALVFERALLDSLWEEIKILTERNYDKYLSNAPY